MSRVCRYIIITAVVHSVILIKSTFSVIPLLYGIYWYVNNLFTTFIYARTCLLLEKYVKVVYMVVCDVSLNTNT